MTSNKHKVLEELQAKVDRKPPKDAFTRKDACATGASFSSVRTFLDKKVAAGTLTCDVFTSSGHPTMYYWETKK